MRYPLLAYGLAISLLCQTAYVSAASLEPAAQLVSESLRNEMSAQLAGKHFAYTSFERSTRTNHRLWEEKVVETEQGILRRLIAIDGQVLSLEKQKSEDEHVARLIKHPEKFHQPNADSDSDEKSRQRMLNALSTAFIFTYEGESGGCKSIRFAPNPTFKPSSYQEHIISLLAGTVYVNESQKRICGVDGTLTQGVEVGFGVLGTLEKGGHIHIERVQTSPGTWENSAIQLHLVGRMFVIRNASQDMDQKRTNVREIPAHLTPIQAALFIKSPISEVSK